jgi:cephalosporin hydroxylase
MEIKKEKSTYIYSDVRFGEENKYSKIALEAEELYQYMYQHGEIIQVMEFLDKNLDSKENGFIEIGSALGASFHCWAKIIENGTKICVDLPLVGSGICNWPPYLNEYVTEFMDINDIGIQNRLKIWNENHSDVHQIMGSSIDTEIINTVNNILKDKQVDFLFIDGNHEYEYIKSDFENYSKFVRPGGYIGFHDIFGQYRGYWGELIAKEPENCIEFVDIFTDVNDDRHFEANKDGVGVRGPGIGIYKKK